MRGVTLLAAAAAAVLGWPGVAHTATCSPSGDTLNVSIPASQGAVITRDSGGFKINGTPCTSQNTLHHIKVTGASGGERLFLQLPLSVAGPGGHVDYQVNLGPGIDSLEVVGTSGADHMVMGALGINFDPELDPALDVTQMGGTEQFRFSPGAGNDTLSGQGGSNTGGAMPAPMMFFDGAGNDTVTGGTGADLINREAGTDTYNGGGGSDFLTNGLAISPVTVDLGATPIVQAFGGGLGVDRLISIENVGGGPSGDILSGTNGVNELDGNGGGDKLVGRGGVDTLRGGPGDDQLDGGSAADFLLGDAGLDSITYAAEPGPVSVSLPGPITAPTGNDIAIDIEKVTGSSFDDTLFGGAGTQIFHGGPGNDTIQGGPGDDQIFGDAGIGDTADYSNAFSGVTADLTNFTSSGGDGKDHLAGIENLLGSPNADVLIGSAGVNRLDGGAGDDVLDGRAGNDTLIGGTDFIVGDVARYSSAPEPVIVDLSLGTATGGDDSDHLSGIEHVLGSAFDDHLIGNNGPNQLIGGAGNDTLEGRGGNDVFVAEPGLDSFDGGDGVDVVDYTTEVAPVTIDLAGGVASSSSGQDALVNIENAVGGSGDDVISGDSGVNALFGGPGNDVFRGRGGDDNFTGGGGIVDTVSYSDSPGPVTVDLTTRFAQGDGFDNFSGINAADGSAFGDTLFGSDTVPSRLRGLGGNDTIQAEAAPAVLAGGPGNDTLTGGGGEDFVDYGASAAAVTVRLDLGTATGEGSDTLSNIEDVAGSHFNDLIVGTAGPNTILGDLGNDILLGLPGADTINGGEGSDFILGGAGSDSLDGGVDALADDHDTVDYETAPIGVTVNLGSPTVADGTGGTDTISNFENVKGSAFADTLTGNAGPNVLIGIGGNDTLSGLAGNDTLNGGDGNDSLDGGADTDTCNQGAGTGPRTSCELGS